MVLDHHRQPQLVELRATGIGEGGHVSADIIPGISAIPTPCPACADSSMPSIELDEGSGGRPPLRQQFGHLSHLRALRCLYLRCKREKFGIVGSTVDHPGHVQCLRVMRVHPFEKLDVGGIDTRRNLRLCCNTGCFGRMVDALPRSCPSIRQSTVLPLPQPERTARRSS